MPSPELYKDKVEVSLDGRQIFYLFFGGAAIVGLVFVLGVMVGRRVEARGHLDRAETQTASDPLAALDRLERSDNLSFHGALTGSEAPTDVEKAIAARAGGKAVDGKAEAKAAQADKPEGKPDAKVEAKAGEVKTDARTDKHEADKKAKKHDDKAEHADKTDKPKDGKDAKESAKDAKDSKDVAKDARDAKETRETSREAREARDAKDSKDAKDAKDAKDTRDGKETRDGKDGKQVSADDRADRAKYTLQLSSFQDKAEAEAFLSSLKSAGYQPYLTQAEVSGKGTFYRVRLGSYRSMEAANDAKAELEKSSHKVKSASVMRL